MKIVKPLKNFGPLECFDLNYSYGLSLKKLEMNLQKLFYKWSDETACHQANTNF